MTDNALSRRAFLGSSSFAALSAVTAAGAAGAGDRLSVAIVGPGGRGRGLMNNFFRTCKDHNAEFTAVCDIWSRNRDLAAESIKKQTGKEPRKFNHLDDLLAARDIDAIIVATSDHAHALQLVSCLSAKKHVYLEKPFANRLDEANTAIDAARKSDRVVTLGTQRRSDPKYVAAAELMKTGVLGPIVGVNINQNAYSPYRWRNASTVKALQEKDTNWKAFLMNRPMRKFDPHRYVEFRLYRDYSSGIIDQWMTHLIDTVHMLTGTSYPRRSVVAHGGCYSWKDGRENGDTVQVSLEYPEGFLATYSCSLANGSGKGAWLLGRNGTLEFEVNWRLTGEGVKGSKIENKPVTPTIKGDMDALHMSNWLECVRKGERKTACTAEHGYQHAIACIMSDQALHSGKKVFFDEKARTIRES